MKDGAIYQESESFWCLTQQKAILLTAALQSIGSEHVHVGYERAIVGYRVILSLRVNAPENAPA